MLIDLDNKPDHVHYGFLLGNGLLHNSTEQVDGKAVWELTEPGIERDTRGEWVTGCIKTLLHMYLDPKYFSVSSCSQPLPTYGEARPVAIHTWCDGEWMHKAYIPIEIPTLLPYMDVISVTVTIVSTDVELAGGGTRKVYAYRPSTAQGAGLHCSSATPITLSLGGRYYSAGYGELKVYECIAAVGGQYLLLLLEHDELPAKLVGRPMNAVVYHDD